MAIAFQEARILITNDRDFGELVVRQRLPHSGIILFRLKNEDLATKQALLANALEHFIEQLAQLLVITSRGIRVRHTPRP